MDKIKKESVGSKIYLLKKIIGSNSASFQRFFEVLFWFFNIFVFLVIGALMAVKTLTLEVLFIPAIVTSILGWFMLIGTILLIVFEFFK